VHDHHRRARRVPHIFEIPREDVGAFTAGWRERIALVDGAPGFRGAQLLEAVSEDERFQLVKVTQWDSREAQQAASSASALRASVASSRSDDGSAQHRTRASTASRPASSSRRRPTGAHCRAMTVYR
jgi:heme-degrading monooxygenase HmoA